MKRYKAIIVSDIHLGTEDSKAVEFLRFLETHHTDILIINGDFVDGWALSRGVRWRAKHTKVISKVLDISRKIPVVWIRGNHDEFLRPMIPYGFSFGLVEIHNQIEHIGADGKHYLVTHGDLFDGITRLAPWIAFLGDKAYDAVLSLNSKYNWIRRRLGFGYFSLSKFLKHKVKKAVDFMFKFEQNLAGYCKKRGYDGVICGHIHHAEIKEIDGVAYMNDGDWVESCTALVEHHDGRWEIVTWTRSSDEPKREDNNSNTLEK